MDFIILGDSIALLRCIGWWYLCHLQVSEMITNFGETTILGWFYVLDCLGYIVTWMGTIWIS